MLDFIKKIYLIIEKKDKIALLGILLVILISSLLDLIGISSIIPIISLISSQNPLETIENDKILSILAYIFKTNDSNTLSIISLCFMICVFAFKSCYSIFTTYVVEKFSCNFERRLSIKLMGCYIHMPYEFHRANNTSTLIRKSTYDVKIFSAAVRSFLEFCVKLSTTIVLFTYLILTSYLITIILGATLLLFSVFFVFILKRKYKKIGKMIQSRENDNYKHLSQAFNGVKESKINNTEDYFITKYSDNINLINIYNVRKSIYHSIPGHTLEFAGILGICLSLLVILQINNSANSSIIQTFGVFAYAVIRLLPCVTEITTYINSFSFYSNSVNTLYEDLKEYNTIKENEEKYNTQDKLVFEKNITLNDVSFSYKDEPDKIILNNINMVIHKNTSTAIYGTTGAGKTTLVDIILGLLTPNKGNIYCDNKEIKNNIKEWRNNISYIPQNIYLTDDTIRNNVAFGIDRKKIDDRKIWEALEKAQLKEFVEQTPHGLDTEIGESGIRLSGGQRQRIGIARAFYRDTNIMVFDESTSALDYKTEENILKCLYSSTECHTLIIITHRLNTIKDSDFIYKVESGKVICEKHK